MPALFAAFLERDGGSLRDPDVINRFVDAVRASAQYGLVNERMLHGRRAEVLFELVVGALGNWLLMKQEDVGEVYRGDDQSLLVPDWRIVLRDRTRLLVEVKNHYTDKVDDPFEMRFADLEALSRYAELMGEDLNFAVFWSQMNLWTLVPPTAFRRQGSDSVLTFQDAVATNRMMVLGDLLLGIPSPLRLRLWFRGENVIERFQVVCRDDVLEEDGAEERLALVLMFYGGWTHVGEGIEILEDGTAMLELTFTADENRKSQEGPVAAGLLSTIASRYYKANSAEDGAPTKIRIPFTPGSVGKLIPDDYNGKVLKLWRFRLNPGAPVGPVEDGRIPVDVTLVP